MTAARRARRVHLPLVLSLDHVEQLFDSFDPAPFPRRDLDASAERYLISWAETLPRERPLALQLHLRNVPSGPAPQRWLPRAVRRHFADCARQARADRRRLLRRGRVSLLFGLGFLFGCLFIAQWLQLRYPGSLTVGVLRESLTIGGWVAMWQPLQIYLHDAWPLLDRERLLRRMSRMPVIVQFGAPAATATATAVTPEPAPPQ